jgi:hypothetical protein
MTTVWLQVEVQSTRAITFEGTVHVFALNEQQKNELTVGLGTESRLPFAVSEALQAAATGQTNPARHPFKGTCSVPVSIAFEPVHTPQPLAQLLKWMDAFSA